MLLGAVALLMASCKPIQQQVSTPMSLELDESALIQTSVARVTLEAAKTRPPAISILSPTEAPTNSSLTVIGTPTLTPNELMPSPTPDLPCNLVQPGIPIDISIPDSSILFPGQEFTKTWRLINGGNCTWTTRYKYSYYSGNPMGAHQENRLITEVQPGQAIDISVPFIAPITPGEYQSTWLMQDEAGNFFGMGLNADIPFYVKIRVEAAPIATIQNP